MPRNRSSRRSRPDFGPGDPGYRTRLGRTGFDPVESAQEEARVVGAGVRSLLAVGRRHRALMVFQGVVALLLVLLAVRGFTAARSDAPVFFYMGSVALLLLAWLFTRAFIENAWLLATRRGKGKR